MIDERDDLDDLMRDLLQESGLERAPSNFTQAVMGQIAPEAKPAKAKWKPIISLRGWIGIGTSVVAATVAAFVLLRPSAKPLPGQAEFDSAVTGFEQAMSSISVPSILAMSALAMAGLYGLDRYLHARRRDTI